MNGRRLHLEYAKSKGEDAVSFINRRSDYYCEILVYQDSKHAIKEFSYNPQDMIHWIIKSCKTVLK